MVNLSDPMQSISKFTLFVVINILLSSCKNDDNPVIKDVPSECNLIEYQQDESGVIYKETYVYDDKSIFNGVKVLTKDSYNYNVTFQYNENGQVQSTDWLPWRTPEFIYDSQGRVRKIVTAYAEPGGAVNSYRFLEYDTKGHLSQLTVFPAGNHGLQDLYNIDFNAFMADLMAKYNNADYDQKEIIKQVLINISCSKFSVDEQSHTVRETLNHESTVTNHKVGDRVEELWDLTTYDGKKNPASSANWRSLNLFMTRDKFSEMGNIVENSNTSSDRDPFGIFKRSYEYNSEGYPISAVQVSTLQKLNLTWKYNCR